MKKAFDFPKAANQFVFSRSYFFLAAFFFVAFFFIGMVVFLLIGTCSLDFRRAA
jgi:hypothetical protein